MKRSTMHGRTPVLVVTSLVAIAVIVAGVRGSMQGALLAVLLGGLLIAYLVRHRMRAQLVYDRRSDPPDGAGPGSRAIPVAHAKGTGDPVPTPRPDNHDR